MDNGNLLEKKFGDDVIKVIDKMNKKQGIFDGIYEFNGKYWEAVPALKFESQCNRVLNESGITKKSDKEQIVRDF